MMLRRLLNGDVVQSTQASLMVFGIAEIVSYLPRSTWLHPGDMIATGTPGGLGSRRTPPLWLKVGALTNQMENEA